MPFFSSREASALRQDFTRDLSAYAGREVRVILNTDPGPKGGGDARNDLAVWGEPHLYSRR